ncbi:MAG TPA: DUF2231 domain-containing protein [Longimicrobiales bacterium]
MRTVANYKSHPIHPALVPYPIAFLHGALVCDVVCRFGGGRRWRDLGSALATAGIAAASLAAIPGLIDYLYSVPPQSSGKKRATRHMLANLGAVAFFGAARLLRRKGRRGRKPPSLAALGLEAVGAGLLTSGAWMGATLVHRNFIGPDHRYPEAGKWREQDVTAAPGAAITVARVDDLEVGQMRLLHVDGRRIVLARAEDGYTAFDDHCTHRGGSLADGVMICDRVQCLWHGSQFDVHTGEVRAGPARQPIGTYRVEQVRDEVRLIFAGGEHGAEHVAGRTAAGAGRRFGQSRAGAGGAGVRGGAAPRV